jgi:hypothetical protein
MVPVTFDNSTDAMKEGNIQSTNLRLAAVGLRDYDTK